MALLFMDGFSHYQTTDLVRKWTNRFDQYCTWEIEPAGGRTAGCIKRTSTSNQSQPGYLLKGPTVRQGSIWSTQTSGVCGFAVKVDDLGKVGGMHMPSSQVISNALLSVYNASITLLAVSLNNDGSLSIYINTGEIIGTTINVISSNSWSYLEFKWDIHVSTGSFIIQANGIEIFNYSGATLKNNYPFGTPSPLWTSIRFLETASTPTPPMLVMRACDFYLLDTTGSHNNSFLGDISIKYIRPDAVGATTNWVPTPAIANWDTVNEVPGNDDTDYVTATAPDSIDLYGYEACNVNPIAIQHCILARRVVPGSATIQSIARPASTNYLQPAASIRNETYEYNLFPYDTNPATGAKWLQAEVDNGQFGVNKAT